MSKAVCVCVCATHTHTHTHTRLGLVQYHITPTPAHDSGAPTSQAPKSAGVGVQQAPGRRCQLSPPAGWQVAGLGQESSSAAPIPLPHSCPTPRP